MRSSFADTSEDANDAVRIETGRGSMSVSVLVGGNEREMISGDGTAVWSLSGGEGVAAGSCASAVVCVGALAVSAAGGGRGSVCASSTDDGVCEAAASAICTDVDEGAFEPMTLFLADVACSAAGTEAAGTFADDDPLSRGGEATALAVDVALFIAVPITPSGEGDRCLNLPPSDVSGESWPEFRESDEDDWST